MAPTRRRSTAALTALAATFALGLAGCGDDGGNKGDADRDRDTSASPDDSQGPDDSASSDGAGTPVEPVQIRRVLEASDAPVASASASASTTPLPSDCDAVAPGQPEPTVEAFACDKEGVVYRLGPAEIVGGVDDADAERPENHPDWVVTIELDQDSADRFADLSGELAGTDRQLAIVLDGSVLSAPVIQGAITDGRVQISGGFDKDTADDLADALESDDGSFGDR